MFANKISFSILNVKEIVKTIKKAICIPSTRMEAVFEGKVTYPTRETMIKPCNERLMIWRSNFVEHNRNDPLLALMSPPKMKKILYTNRGLELHKVNPSPVRKSIFTKGNIGALLAKEPFTIAMFLCSLIVGHGLN